MRRFGKMLMVSAAVLALAGCNGSGGSPVVGKWGGEGEGAAQLVFDSSGTFSGSDGCAPASGTWYQQGQDIHVTVGAMAMIMCPPGFWMNSISTVRVVDGELLISNAKGRLIGELPPRD